MKRTLCIMLTITLLAGMLALGASAEETSGTCGDALTWKFENKTLTISGTGDMYDYGEYGAPWEGLTGINKWVIESGVTSIGNGAFCTRRHAMYGTIAASVKKIGSKAFANAHCSIYFLGSAPEIAEDAFENAYGACYYITGWEDADLQSYGGTQRWKKGELQPTNRKTVYAVNEQIKAEDFTFRATFSGAVGTDYTPQTIRVESYDNSTCGEKTVNVWADGVELVHTYFVSDGKNHLDAVRVKKPLPVYFGEVPEPVVTAGSMVLTKNVHYTVSYQNSDTVGTKASVTVTGLGEWQGFSKTVNFAVLKQDVNTDDSVSVYSAFFEGVPIIPETASWKLKAGEDYVAYFENNVNMGDATYRVVGTGNYCGSKTGTFEIKNSRSRYLTLEGEYNGQADGELDTEKCHYQSVVWAPGPFIGEVNATVGSHSKKHAVFYRLYQLVGDEAVLIHEEETDYGRNEVTNFEYNFSHVYEGSVDTGGEIYMLAYTWVNSDYGVYTGVCTIIVPAKVPDATQMAVEVVEGIGDFRYAYLTAYGLDGNVGKVTWTSSDPAVASIDDGIVTMKKPGIVTFTAQYGDLSESIALQILPEDLTKGTICNYDAQTKKAYVYYDGFLLEEGVDYTLSVKEKSVFNFWTEVTVTGINLFEGQLLQSFDDDGNSTRVGWDHSHGFENPCDTTCGSCRYVREIKHAYDQRWSRNATHHWHSCTACGAVTGEAAHTMLAEDPDSCSVCGLLNIPGDLNVSYMLDEADAIYLLCHVLLPDQFPLTRNAEYTGDGVVNEDDAIYLLRHILMAEMFPIAH